jgi:hypothetical protein
MNPIVLKLLDDIFIQDLDVGNEHQINNAHFIEVYLKMSYLYDRHDWVFKEYCRDWFYNRVQEAIEKFSFVKT